MSGLRQGQEGVGKLYASIPNNLFNTSLPSKIGQVIGAITGENLPTVTQYERAGGINGIGSILYIEVNTNGAFNITGSYDDNLYNRCSIAKPFSPLISHIPLIGELVYLKEDFPSSNDQIEETAIKTYYLGIINSWGSTQLNSNNNTNPGITYKQNPNIKPLLPFIGDHIIQGRQGSALRFSTTTKLYKEVNEWSTIGSENDPITILTNGFAYNPKNKFYVEHINKDLSSIYLTSTQQIPLQTDKSGVLNNLTNPLDPSKYFSSQVIINSDRVTLNSKKDEVMIFAKTNVEINTKNVINLNADERVHLNSNSVFLGPYSTSSIPQPVLLGYETIKVFEQLQETLTRLATYLSSTISAPEGAPIVSLNSAGKELLNDMKKMCDLLENITSKKVFTS